MVSRPNPRGLTVGEPQSPTSSTSGTAVASTPPTPGQAQCDEYTHGEFERRPDVDEDLDRPVEGYPKLARTIAKHPEFEAFQTFRDLNIKSLLYYQAELAELREDLHRLEWKDFREEPYERASECCTRADVLLLGSKSQNPHAKKQMELIKRIREVLKEYNAALVQYSQISAFPEADSYNVNTLRTWLSRRPIESQISGPGDASWGDLGEEPPEPKTLKLQFWHLVRSPFWTAQEEEKKLDLIVPRAGIKVDGLARWVANEFVPCWQSFKEYIRELKQSSADEEKGTKLKEDHQVSSKKKKRTGGVFPRSNAESGNEQQKLKAKPAPEDPDEADLNTYKEGPMLRFTSAVATIVACLLPTVAISVLAQLHTTAELLGIIAVFTAVFAAGLMMLVDSGTSRVEIFTATAAFSAVMVVFVQNQNSGPYQQGGSSLAVNGTRA